MPNFGQGGVAFCNFKGKIVFGDPPLPQTPTPLETESLPSKRLLSRVQEPPKGFKRLQKPPKKPETQDLPDPQVNMRFFSTEIDGFGRPSILSPKGPGKPQEAPKGHQKALKATKRLQKAFKRPETQDLPGPKKPEAQDLPDPQVKMRFFSTEIDGFGRPSILSQKGKESPRKPPRATKRL